MKWQYIAALVFFLIAGACTGFTISKAIENSHIDFWLTRAQAAGTPGQSAEFLMEYKVALYEADKVEGYYWTIFKYPGTSVELHIRVIDGLIGRAEALESQSPNDESYQMGLINLEKDLNDIGPAAFSVWFANGGFVVVWVMSAAWTFSLVFGLWGLFKD